MSLASDILEHSKDIGSSCDSQEMLMDRRGVENEEIGWLQRHVYVVKSPSLRIRVTQNPEAEVSRGLKASYEASLYHPILRCRHEVREERNNALKFS